MSAPYSTFTTNGLFYPNYIATDLTWIYTANNGNNTIGRIKHSKPK